jgi:hypothetical protein
MGRRKELSGADLVYEALKKAGVKVKRDHVSMIADMLGQLGEEEEDRRPGRGRGRARQELIEPDLEELPDEFFLEIPIMIPAQLSSRGRILLDLDDMDLEEELDASIASWEEEQIPIYMYEEEEGEGLLLEPTGRSGAIKIR